MPTMRFTAQLYFLTIIVTSSIRLYGELFLLVFLIFYIPLHAIGFPELTFTPYDGNRIQMALPMQFGGCVVSQTNR